MKLITNDVLTSVAQNHRARPEYHQALRKHMAGGSSDRVDIDMGAASKLIIIGAGGHAKVIIEAIRIAARQEIVGLIAPKGSASKVLDVPVLGDEGLFSTIRAQGIENVVVAVGDNAMRERTADRLVSFGLHLLSVVHPSAAISPSATIGDGAVIMARALIGTETAIGRLAIVNSGAVVDHDNVLGVASHVGPGSSLAGHIRIGCRTLLGVGSSVRPGVMIGDDVVIGAGSAVVCDVEDGDVIGGVPARRLPRG